MDPPPLQFSSRSSFSGPSGPRLSPQPTQQWEWACAGGPPPVAPHAYATPPPAFAATAGAMPVFCTAAELTLDSASPSPGSAGRDSYYTPGTGAREAYPVAPGPAPHPHLAPAVAPHPQLLQLEQQNAQLARQCQELQVRGGGDQPCPALGWPCLQPPTCIAIPPPQARLEAAEAQRQEAAQASPAASTQACSQGGQASPPGSAPTPFDDPEELARLQRQLAAKQREAGAAAQAADAAAARLAQREGELEVERGRAAALADEVARWKDEWVQVGAGWWVLAGAGAGAGCSGPPSASLLQRARAFPVVLRAAGALIAVAPLRLLRVLPRRRRTARPRAWRSAWRRPRRSAACWPTSWRPPRSGRAS